MSERDPECCKTGVHLPPISPPVKPEPRTSEPSEASEERATRAIWEIAKAIDSARGFDAIPLLVREFAEVARAAKVEALTQAADTLREALQAEEDLESFDCPHDAEHRCQCGTVELKLIAAARALRKAAISSWDALKEGR